MCYLPANNIYIFFDICHDLLSQPWGISFFSFSRSSFAVVLNIKKDLPQL